jgi:hypothetical protein
VQAVAEQVQVSEQLTVQVLYSVQVTQVQVQA